MINLHRMDQEWSELGATWNCSDDTDPFNSSPDCVAQWDGGAFVAAPTASLAQSSLSPGYAAGDAQYDASARAGRQARTQLLAMAAVRPIATVHRAS